MSLTTQGTACVYLDVSDSEVHRLVTVFAWPRIAKHLKRLGQQNVFVKAFLPLWSKPYIGDLQVYEIRWRPE